MLKYLLFLIFNIIIAIVGFYWLKNNFHYDMFSSKIYQLNFAAVGISLIPQILLILCYGKRVGILLNKKMSTSFAISSMGHGLNHIIPFRLGEVLKIVFAKRFFNISIYELSLVSIVEKSFDLLCVSLLGLMLLVFSKNLFSLGLLVVMIVATLFIIIALRSKTLIKAVFKIIPMRKYLDQFYDAVNHFELNGKMLVIIIYTLFIWILTNLNLYYFFLGNLPGIDFSIIDAMALVVLSSFSLALPVTIGNIGIFEGAIIFYLKTKYGVIPEEAMALAVIFHLILAVPQLIIMAFYILMNECKIILNAFSRERKKFYPVTKAS